MSDITLGRAELQVEKQDRNALFAEVEQEALRLSYECSENPIDEFPLQFGGNIFGLLLPQMPQYHADPIKWRSVHAYAKHDYLEAAVFYEQRAKGFGHYYRLRTASIHEAGRTPLMKLSDFAIKTSVPKRSLRWSIAELSLTGKNCEVLSLDQSYNPDPLESLLRGGLIGADLTPDQWLPRTNADFVTVKGRLLQAATILSNLSCKTVLQTPADLPTVLRQPISYPLYYNAGGVSISRPVIR